MVISSLTFLGFSFACLHCHGGTGLVSAHNPFASFCAADGLVDQIQSWMVAPQPAGRA